MDLKLNFLGMHVADFNDAFHFFTELLGIEVGDSEPNWAYLETTGMTFELFGAGELPALQPSWGRGQSLRPSFQVNDLQRTVSELRQKGIKFTGDRERTSWGESIEFIAPQGIRWTLAHAPGYPSSSTLSKPHLGWVEIKTHNLSAQQTFYSDVMGLQVDSGSAAHALLRQEDADPLLLLEGGGERPSPVQSIAQAPLFISFETDSIQQAARWLKSHQVTILEDVTQRDWGGTDLIVLDAGGSPIQVVQYAAK